MLMNAVPRSVVPPQRHRSRRPAADSRVTRSRAALSLTVTSLPSSSAGQKVEKLNASQRVTPPWVSSLLFVKRSSDVITFLLVAATLSIYSWTVYTQQQWSQEYRNLDKLRRQERQMATADAMIKNQLAQQAESPAMGLVNPTQANTIVLPPAPQRPVHTAPTKTTESEPVATTPLGY